MLLHYIVDVAVLQLYANDPDGGQNGSVTFSLVEPSALFQVSPSGRISRVRGASFDRETRGTHQLMVKAADSGNPRSTGIYTSLFV